MKTDTSFILYSKLQRLKDRRVEIILKNQSRLMGEFIGFFKGDAFSKENYILQWHFVEETHLNLISHQAFEVHSQRLISHCNIAQVYFLEDDSALNLF